VCVGVVGYLVEGGDVAGGVVVDMGVNEHVGVGSGVKSTGRSV